MKEKARSDFPVRFLLPDFSHFSASGPRDEDGGAFLAKLEVESRVVLRGLLVGLENGDVGLWRKRSRFPALEDA